MFNQKEGVPCHNREKHFVYAIRTPLKRERGEHLSIAEETCIVNQEFWDHGTGLKLPFSAGRRKKMILRRLKGKKEPKANIG